MKESKLNKILEIGAKTLFGISALALAGYVADAVYFHKLNLDFFPTGYVSLTSTIIWGITAKGISMANSIRRNNRQNTSSITFENLDEQYQACLEYFALRKSSRVQIFEVLKNQWFLTELNRSK